ncbi:MAG: alkanesulfonate monooxygenase SsuD, partial [Candidatus Azotimanducaceae bacterium]
PAALRRTARFGSGWYGFGLTPEAAKKMLDKVAAALEKAGRSMEGFRVVITPPYDFDESRIPEYEALGVDELVFHLGSQKPERVAQRMRYMEQVLA